MSFNMFDAADEGRWLAAVEKALGGKPFDVLTSRSRDSIDLKPLYKAASVSSIDGRNAAQPWTIVQRVDDPDLNRASSQIADDLANGASGLVFVTKHSPHSHGMGLDALDKDTWSALLSDVFPEMITIRIEAGNHAREASEGLIAALAAKGTPHSTATVSFGLDPIGSGFSIGDVSAASSELASLSKTLLPLTKAEFSGSMLSADGRLYHAAGASEAQELAGVLATTVAYLRQLESDGVLPQDSIGLIELCLAADADQFMTIAKLRAARLLWGRVCEAMGLTSVQATLHTETAWRMVTKRDAQVNMLRSTMACFAAGVGGADSLTILPYTSVLGLPDGFARRIARNTQLILLEESNLAHVSDPAAGSGSMEGLTKDLAGKAWSLFQTIEAQGGILDALSSGWYQEQIAEVRAARDRDIAKSKEPITGTSAFPLLEEPSIEVLAAPEQSTRAVDDKLALTPRRNGEMFEALRDAADAKAKASGARPAVFLATLGTQAEFTGRLTFMQNFLAAGGIGSSAAGPLTSAEDVVSAFKDSGCTLACLCSTDERYADMAADTVAALKAAGAEAIYLAGKPGDLADSLDTAGLTGSITLGMDMVAALSDLHQRLGIQ